MQYDQRRHLRARARHVRQNSQNVAWSIERSFFPSFIERGETFLASIYRDYWIDIGTPEKYMQVHRDIMDGRYLMPPFNGGRASHGSRREHGSTERASRGSAFVDEGCIVRAGARLGPYTVLGRNCHVGEDANVAGAIVWADSHIEREAQLIDTIVGRAGEIGRNAQLQRGVLGDKTQIAEYSRL